MSSELGARRVWMLQVNLLLIVGVLAWRCTPSSHQPHPTGAPPMLGPSPPNLESPSTSNRAPRQAEHGIEPDGALGRPRRLLSETHCHNLFPSGDGRYVTTGQATDGTLSLLQLEGDSASPINSGLAVQSRAVLSGAGLLVQGFADPRRAGPEQIFQLDDDGKRRCQADVPSLSEQIGLTSDQLEFVGLFEGGAVFTTTHTSAVYAFSECARLRLLGECREDEVFEWEDGPVCLSRRRARVLADAGTVGRLSPDDTGYSASNDGVLRVFRSGPASLRVAWLSRDPQHVWSVSVALPEPLELVVDAAGNRWGGALWLRAPSSANSAQLVVLDGDSRERRSTFPIDLGGRPQVAAAERGWAATLPFKHASDEPKHRRQCWFTSGFFGAGTD